MHHILLAAACAMIGTAAMAAPPSVGKTAKGDVLVDGRGMTLYTFDRDSGGHSACEGGCAANWPPLAAAKGETGGAGLSVIERPDGSHQWAYKSRPLYGWAKDKAPGDTTGDGMNGVWHIARP